MLPPNSLNSFPTVAKQVPAGDSADLSVKEEIERITEALGSEDEDVPSRVWGIQRGYEKGGET